MKNTLVFLNIEGIGLNPKWKGNYLKLVEKPNLNYLISGLFPWSIITNDKPGKKNIINTCVSKDIDKNFSQTILGSKTFKTVSEQMDSLVQEKNLLNLDIFNKIQKHCKEHNSYSHLFFLLSSNTFHIKKNHIKLVINALLKKGVKVVLHLIADGRDCIPYSFYEEVDNFFKFCLKRKVAIVSITGRENVFIKIGHSYDDCDHVQDYFKHIVGLGDNGFESPILYAKECLFNKVDDALIPSAINKTIYKNFIEENDSIVLLDYDSDVYSSLLYLLNDAVHGKFQNLHVASMSKIYGHINHDTFFDNHNLETSLPNIVAQNDMKSLVVSLPHKKGFIEKYYGNKENPNIDKKSIKLKDTNSYNDYIFNANKLLIDKAINSVGKYDFIIIHNPIIAEIAKFGDLKLLKTAVEIFDKNLGRLMNFLTAGGNCLALASSYGAIEKMINKKSALTPYNKKSPTFFVINNGNASSKALNSNFCSIYSTLLTFLGIDNHSEKNSLISQNYNQKNMNKRYIADFNVWKNSVASPLINDFMTNKMSLYNDMEKDNVYLAEKQNYIVLKEMLKINDRISTTSKSRKKIYDYLLEYTRYNNIDFEGFKYDLSKILMTMFDDEILQSKPSKLSRHFLEDNILLKKIRKTNRWIKKIKLNNNPITIRKAKNKAYESVDNAIMKNFEPHLFFEKYFASETEIFETNSAVNLVNFYSSMRDEVYDVFNTYFYPKIKMLTIEDDYDDSTDIIEETQESMPQRYFKIYSYMKTFDEIISIVESQWENAPFFDEKISEVYHSIDKSKSIYDYKSFQINKLLREILSIHNMWVNGCKIHMKISNSKVRQIASNFNVKYSREINQKINSYVYDGEFLESIDLSSQKILKEKMGNKIKKVGLFDNPSIDKSVDENISMAEMNNYSDTNYIDVEIEPVRTRTIYNKSQEWKASRIVESPTSERDESSMLFENVVQEIQKNRKVYDSEKIIEEYFKNSKLWSKNNTTKNSFGKRNNSN
ncbi:MAG: hypothetical protein RSA40_00740 [Malacoplasma sp.]